ncbi:MAG: monovalent cation/H+ antiporter complex subunit F [Halofilum sp. (in: g-proteobacteria)]|nr:monovalent cation/H+ antiporter complex subunit F [Halofilum sp. (in: g-proteobacteria)]
MFWAYALVTVALLVVMAIALGRAIVGPTLPDRVLALNAFGTATVLLIVSLGFLEGRPAFTDIGLVYALINFVGTIALLKFFQYRDLGHAEAAEDET